MFLRCNRRFKDGKAHRYWSIVENRRCRGGRVVQRPVLYLGEINDHQREAWARSIEAFDEDAHCQTKLRLFAAEGAPAAPAVDAVQVRLSELVLRRPRQWGACWLFSRLWEQLGLEAFWRDRLGRSREKTDWEHVLQAMVAYRRIDPGSEWRLHRHWYAHSAMGDLLGEDDRLVAKDTLYRCLDLLLAHKEALFGHLTQRWRDLFGVKFEVLLYDLTSTYFESEPPEDPDDPRKHGYSRDKRPDCVQVVIGLIVTPEGFPLAYEVLAGNPSDKTTLAAFLQRIEAQYGRAERIWVMDRGIPTEEVLAQMRQSQPPVYYLVGTPKSRLSPMQAALAEQPWQAVREGVEVKLRPLAGELYVLARSRDRRHKERAIRRRQLKRLWQRLRELQQSPRLKRDALLLKLGAAKNQYPAAWRLIALRLPRADEPVNAKTFHFRLRKTQLREVLRNEGRYRLRTNLSGDDPARLWAFYIQLTHVEAAFKNLKGDLALRPIFHHTWPRIEAHIFVAFLAYCLQVTLRQRLRVHAPGLTPRAVLEKFATVQMLDAQFPTTDGRWLTFARFTQPEKDVQLLLAQLALHLPPQSPPRISAKGQLLAP
ncbi:MAG: IS1634 family transposase [Verrucomicrobia bacterium]|nr:IS1634 family transposase [Verrucomicrobiota bacterium]